MVRKTATYVSYLLRAWRADNGGRPVWRFSLQPMGGGPPLVFDDVNAMMAFLEGGDGRPDSEDPDPLSSPDPEGGDGPAAVAD